jgi:ribose transport system permease protein
MSTKKKSTDTSSITIQRTKGTFPGRGKWILDTPVIQFTLAVLLFVVLAFQVPSVLRPQSLIALGLLASLLALVSLGQTLVVILGGLDLAIPGYVVIGAYMATTIAGARGVPVQIALLLTALLCGAVGVFVGYICHRFRIQPLVVTLGVGTALTGLALFMARGDYSASPPDGLRDLTRLNGQTFGIPIPPLLFILVAVGVAIWLFLNKTGSGRKLYATGVNVRAAGLARVSTRKIWVSVFGFSGAVSGLAGMFIASFGAGWTQAIGEPYLFSGLAAVLVGGTTFGAVTGSFTRTILGAVILTLLSTIIVSNGLSDAQSRIVYGLIILAVVSFYAREKRVQDRF